MHPGGMRSAMDLFDFEKSANLKHPNTHCMMNNLHASNYIGVKKYETF